MEEANRRINEWIALKDPTKALNLSSLGLKTLPSIPEKCQILWCNNNQLTTLPSSLQNCQYLSCHNNKYLHITKKQALKFNLKETPNYHKCSLVIQKAYKSYLKRKYQPILNQYLYLNLSKVVCSYI